MFGLLHYGDRQNVCVPSISILHALKGIISSNSPTFSDNIKLYLSFL